MARNTDLTLGLSEARRCDQLALNTDRTLGLNEAHHYATQKTRAYIDGQLVRSPKRGAYQRFVINRCLSHLVLLLPLLGV